MKNLYIHRNFTLHKRFFIVEKKCFFGVPKMVSLWYHCENTFIFKSIAIQFLSSISLFVVPVSRLHASGLSMILFHVDCLSIKADVK